MSEFDCTRHACYTLVKSTTGKDVGLALIPRGADVKIDDLFTVGEDLGDAMESPKLQMEANLSNTFVEKSVSSPSIWRGENKQDFLNTNLHQTAASAMVASLAEKMIKDLGCRRKNKQQEEMQVNQDTQKISVEQDLRSEEKREVLLGCGLVEAKEELDKPGRYGWIREVVTHFSKSHITGVKYITPSHPITRTRRRVSTRKEIMEYLKTSGTAGELSYRNFNFNTRFLGLSPEYEVIRRSMARGSNMVEPQFAKYCKELPMDEKDGYQSYNSWRVECLIENCGAQMSRGRFSTHMRKLHLPDEVCINCGREFPASTIKTHQSSCKVENMDGERTDMKRGENIVDKMRRIDRAGGSPSALSTEANLVLSSSGGEDI